MGNLLTRHWRELETGGSWTEAYKVALLDNIEKEEIPKVDVERPRILIWGAAHAGKSSFINSLASTEKGRLVHKVVVAAGAKESVTRKLHVCELYKYYWLDVMGIEKGNFEGLHQEDIRFLLAGNVQQGYTFEKNHISPECAKFKADTLLAEKAHCNILVVSALDISLSTMDINLREKLIKVLEHANNADVATILILTKIDLVCTQVENDVKNVYSSKIIGEVVQKASEIFGIPIMHIFPVKNYTKETQLKTNMDILLLLAARQCVRYACDHLTNVSQEQTLTRKV